jgi:hypothetical protein
MKQFIRLLCVFGVAVTLGFAESADTFVAIGAGVTPDAMGKPYGVFAWAKRLDERTYVTTAMDIHLSTLRNLQLFDISSFRPGIERILYVYGPVIVAGRADGGVATSSVGSTGGAFSGGGSVAFSLRRWVKKDVYFFGSGRFYKTSLGDSQPVYSFGLVFPVAK